MPLKVTPDLLAEALGEDNNEELRRSVCSSVLTLLENAAVNVPKEMSIIIPSGICDEFPGDVEVPARLVTSAELRHTEIATIDFKRVIRHTDGVQCRINNKIIITLIDDRICMEVDVHTI